MKEITLRQLEYFVAVADQGSISKGAAQCHVSPMAVGQALNELEHSLGAKLTQRRRSKGVTLTDLGDEIAKHARDILRSAERLPQLIDAATGRMKSTLRIGTFPTLSGWAIPPVIAEFTERYPEVQLEPTEADYDTLHEQLQRGALDIALTFQTHVKSGVQVIPIAPIEMRVLVSTEHPFAQRESVPLSELGEENLLIQASQPVSTILTDLLRTQGVAHAVRWQLANTDAIKNLVGRNLAVSPLISPGISFVSNEGMPLTAIPLSGEIPAQAVVACTPEGLPTSPALRVIVDILSRHSAQTLTHSTRSKKPEK